MSLSTNAQAAYLKALTEAGILIKGMVGSVTPYEFRYQATVVPCFRAYHSFLEFSINGTQFQLLRTYIESVFPQYAEVMSNLNSDYPAAWETLELLYFSLKENKPKLFFGNGNVRKKYTGNLISRFAASESLNTHKLSLETLRRWYEVQHHWAQVPREEKERLVAAGVFTMEGTLPPVKTRVSYITATGHVTQGAHYMGQLTRSTLASSHYGGEVYFVTAGQEERETIQVYNGQTYSVSPIETAFLNKYYTKCTECGKYEIKGNLLFGMCRTCTQDSPRELENYTTRATNKFASITKRSKYSGRLSGVELEYERNTSYELPEALFFLHKHLKDHAIFKRDGSLSHGIEICTRPASVDIQLDSFKGMFEDKDCMERLSVENTCGMHVHMDKAQLSALTLGKLIHFVQSKHNKDFLAAIAGRESNHYSKTGTDHSVTSVHRGQATSDRYQALNLTNQATIEFRMFRTPADFGVFAKNMEFVDALTRFAQPANSGVKDTQYEAFLKYVQDNRSTYKELFKFAKETF